MGMKISEMITDKYKLRIPPTVYYDLLADVQEAEDEQESITKNDLGVDCISRQAMLDLINADWKYENLEVETNNLPSVTPQEPKTDIEEKIHKMKTEIADSLEFWDYSPNNNPLARDMLETLTNFWGDMREVEE